MKIMSIITLVTLLTGCSTGRLVCEWQSEDEQLQEIVNEVLEERQIQEKTRQADVEKILQQTRRPDPES